jgi:hypothetical protein
LLAALVLAGACGEEPAPQHPTHKKHKTHDDGDVVVADDTDAKDSDDKPKKKHHKASDDADTKRDDDKPKKKHHKASDDTDAKRDDDKPTSKHRKVADKGDDADTKPDDDKPKKPHHKAAKKSDDAEPKKADDADATKDDDDAHAKIAKRAPKKPTKRKHAPEPKAPAPEPKADAGAEIEIDDAPPASGAGQAAAEPAAATDEPTAAVAAPMPAPAPAASPLAINDRPLVTRPGALEVHGGLRTAVLTLPGVMPGTSTSTTSEGLALGATYGVTDKVEIGADYVLSLHPGAIKGPLTFHGAYLALASGKLDVAVAGALAVDFQDSTDPTTGKTTTTTSYGLQVGGWVRYRVAPKLALFTGLPALPASPASLSKLSFALPPLPYQLAIGLNNAGTIALDLPAGVGFQVTPAIYAFGMTNLAHLKISNSANAFLFKDFIPVTVGAFYALDKLDLGATLADDLKQGAGYLSFELMARYALQ